MAKQVKSKQVAKKRPAKAKVVKKKVSPFEFESVTENLSDRQKLFCMLYAGECKLNGAEAAKKAGYSENGAKEQAARLLTYANVNSFIAELKKDLGLRIGVTAEMIAKEYAKVAFFDIAEIYNEDGSLKKIHEMPVDARAAVTGVDAVELYGDAAKRIAIGETKKVRIANKLDGLERLAKMIGVDGVAKVEMKVNAIGTDVEPEETYE